MKKSVDVKVPCEIRVNDYHEFSYIEDLLKILNPKLKCTEIGYDPASCRYVGIVYITKSDLKKSLNKWQDYLTQFESDFDAMDLDNNE